MPPSSYDHIAANEDTVAPAVEEVEAPDPSEAEYLPFESRQLTANVIANLTEHRLSDVALFDFDNETEAALARRTGRACKTYPGDSSWPSPETWNLFNVLSDSVLEDGVPPASVCYANWPGYDEAKCEEVTTKWSTPQYQ